MGWGGGYRYSAINSGFEENENKKGGREIEIRGRGRIREEISWRLIYLANVMAMLLIVRREKGRKEGRKKYG